MIKQGKIKLLSGEKISILSFKKSAKGLRYAVTSAGRIISFTEDARQGRIIKASNLNGYLGVAIGNKSYNVHRLAAKQFQKPATKKHKIVIHLNYKKDDNRSKNLKWVTLAESFAHTHKNPNYKNSGASKLTESQVINIKKLLQRGNLSLKAIAQKYDVSDMQIFRIKSGENWGHIKI